MVIIYHYSLITFNDSTLKYNFLKYKYDFFTFKEAYPDKDNTSIFLSSQPNGWNNSACSVSGGELYVPVLPAEEGRIKDLFYQHQISAAWINIRSEYGPRWLNGSYSGKIY